jgi:hypothetical protein
MNILYDSSASLACDRAFAVSNYYVYPEVVQALLVRQKMKLTEIYAVFFS